MGRMCWIDALNITLGPILVGIIAPPIKVGKWGAPFF